MEVTVNLDKQLLRSYKEYIGELGKHQYDEDLTEYKKADRKLNSLYFMVGQIVMKKAYDDEQERLIQARIRMGLWV